MRAAGIRLTKPESSARLGREMKRQKRIEELVERLRDKPADVKTVFELVGLLLPEMAQLVRHAYPSHDPDDLIEVDVIVRRAVGKEMRYPKTYIMRIVRSTALDIVTRGRPTTPYPEDDGPGALGAPAAPVSRRL